ncbi:MAG: hypothetical protein ACREJC_04650 [Tepidisphaeraceae bacterium]
MNYLLGGAYEDAVNPEEISIGPNAGYLENTAAAFFSGRAGDVLYSRENMLDAARKERRIAVEKATGKPFGEAIAPYEQRARDTTPGWVLGTTNIEDKAIDLLAADIPERTEKGGIFTGYRFEERAREIGSERRAHNAEVAARGRGSFLSLAGQFTGGAGAFMTDPLTLATLPFGAGASIPVAMAVEAALAAGVTVAAAPWVNEWRREMGEEATAATTAREAAINALAAAGTVGLLRGAGRGGGALLRVLKNKRALARAFDQTVTNPTPDARAARAALEAELETAESSPFEPTPEGDRLHMERLRQAQADAESGRAPSSQPPSEAPIAPGRGADLPPDEAVTPAEAIPPTVPRETVSPPLKPPREIVAALPKNSEVNGGLEQLDPEDLIVDAKRFQFKAGGDEAGVTDRLKGVQTWDPMRGGIIVVWENSKGERFLVDGHQRHALATRLQKAGQKPKLLAVILRESDGVTEDTARSDAAAKNIAEGTGTAIDAAKILRARPEVGIDLPPQSALVRDAQGLARLSDEAFGAVVNDVIPPSYAAIIGRLADDKATHEQLVALLAKHEPRSALEAESMVRDALTAPQVQQTMTDLFGSAEVTQILFKERARILSAAAAALKKDRQAFGTLVREERRITEAGNVLDQDINRRRADEDAQLIETLQKLARRVGPVADALARAAKSLNEGRKLGDAVAEFVEDVRRGGEAVGPEGGGAGAARQPGERGDAGREGGEVELTEPAEPDAAYRTAVEAHNEAVRAYQAMAANYRAGKIGDKEFLAAKAVKNEADGRFDAAFAAAQKQGVPEEPGAEGKPQAVIPGAGRDVAGALQRAAEAPLKPKAPQKLEMDVGLFGDEKNQTDFFDAALEKDVREGMAAGDLDVPVDESGAVAKASDILRDLDEDREFIEALDVCL